MSIRFIGQVSGEDLNFVIATRAHPHRIHFSSSQVVGSYLSLVHAGY